MNTNNKVVFDFTQTNSPTDVAIMPASIARRALRALAEQCSKANPVDIMMVHTQELYELQHDPANYGAFIAKSQDFVQERILMDNIQAENWGAYTVEEQ